MGSSKIWHCIQASSSSVLDSASVWQVLLLGITQSQNLKETPYKTDLESSFAIGIVGDAGVRGTAQQPRLFVGMILILIFAEVLGTLSSDITKAHHSILNRINRPLWSHCSFTHELKSYARCYMLDSSAQARPSYKAPSPTVCCHSRTTLYSKMHERERETGRTSFVVDVV